MIEIQCTSCHTRYRIDEQVLPAGTPTFKCSRCGHVFSFEPRAKDPGETDVPGPHAQAEVPQKPRRAYSSPQKLAPLKAGSATGRNGEIKDALEDIAAAHVEAGAKSASFRAWQEANQPEEADAATPPADSEGTPGGDAEGGDPTSRPTGRENMAPAQGDSTAHDDPLARPFRRAAEESESGENLAFDFHDEQSEPSESGETDEHLAPDSEDKWQVGDLDDIAAVERARATQAQRAMELGAITSAPSRPRTRRPRKRSFDEDFVDESAAPLYRTTTHSSRVFLGLFLVVAVVYGLLTLMIHSAPAAASEMLSRVPLIGERFVPPVTPASLVALRNVNSNYQRIKDGHNALVITGEAENVAGTALHVVQIKVDLQDTAQRTVDRHEVYCGNNLTPKMVGEMTPHEIDFFQKLDPPKTFTLAASDKCPFTLVFIDPPDGVARFDIAVAQAVRAPAPAAASNDF